jgi:hypothetical protein
MQNAQDNVGCSGHTPSCWKMLCPHPLLLEWLYFAVAASTTGLLWAGIAQWYSIGLWAGWSDVWVPAWAGNFSLHHHWLWDPASLLTNWYQGLFPWGESSRGVKLTTNFHLVPRSVTHGAIPPLPQNASMAWCSVKSKAQEQLYLCLYLYHWLIMVPYTKTSPISTCLLTAFHALYFVGQNDNSTTRVDFQRPRTSCSAFWKTHWGGNELHAA